MNAPTINYDYRQSQQWANYLQTLGWKTHSVNNTQLAMYKYFGFSVAKVQKPSTLNQSTLDEIEQICKKNNCLVITIEPHDVKSADLLRQNDYKKSVNPLAPTKTLITDLTLSQSDLWEELSTSGKYGVNRAKREGIKVNFYKNPKQEQIKEFYSLYENSAKTNGFKKYSMQDLENKGKAFGDLCVIGLAKNTYGELLNGAFYIGTNTDDKKAAWYLHGGTSKKGRNTKAGYLLFWEALEHLKNKGFELLDYEGIFDERFPHTKHWQGFSEFKTKFGGTEVTYPEPYVKILNPVLKTLDKVVSLEF